ncbi:MAG: hypothetical protein JSV51_09265 [Candidatus Bathyarchaeota archaeon]|nr:MAG: hypothetical protein JSV51_09265 [Candidatus Bathyarchaeota archaeon]
MPLTRKGLFLIVAIIMLFILSTGLTLLTPWDDPTKLFIRVFALFGYLSLALTTAITPFLVGIGRAFGKSFIKIHHIFSIFGIIFTTLHPALIAIRALSAAIFVPRFDSWEIFWALAGRPAFIFLYIALASAVFRRRTPKHWRLLHMLMYIVLFLGIVHANLIGTDFQNIGIQILFNLLFVTSLVTFILKRYRNYVSRKRIRSM